ncbi:MAG: MATE family efflux transporter [Saprospiraceae bacterium]
MNIISKYKSDFRQNTKISLPIIAGQLGQVAVYIVDNIMVGKLGASSLAAVSLGTALYAIVMVIGFGLSFGLPPLISEADGSNRPDNVSRFFKHSLIINIIIGIVFTGVLWIGIPYLDFLGQNPEVANLAKGYLYFTALSSLPFMLFLTLRSFSDALSDTVPAMTAMIIGNICNIILNYLFIYGKFGMPAYGVAGAALASLIARIIMLVVLFGIIYYKKQLWNYIAACNFKKYQWTNFKKVLDLGVPSALQMFFEISAFSGAALIMGMVGKNEQAAHQVAINISSITFMICTGIAMASTIRVGNQLGQNNMVGVRNAGISAIIQVSIVMAICSLIFFVFHSTLALIYINDPLVVSIASTLLIYAAIFQIPDGVQVTALAALRGIKDVKTPTVITLISYYVFGLPISYYTAIILKIGAPGVWLGLLIGLFISATLLTYRFSKLTKVVSNI